MKEQVGTTTDQFIAGLIIAILFSCSVSAAVCPSAGAVGVWSETYGGTNDDRALSLVATSDGGYALAGSTDSFGAGGYDFWLAKTERVSGLSTITPTASPSPSPTSLPGSILPPEAFYAIAAVAIAAIVAVTAIIIKKQSK